MGVKIPALVQPILCEVRADLDTQISGALYAADTPNLIKADNRAELQWIPGQDVRRITIRGVAGICWIYQRG
jgi:type I restriction enzyme, R subunit